jgi:ubiquinone/menaquinone biosynthesis C-methylase UbiE
VPDPSAVIYEVARVLKVGGVACFLEVDNATFRSDPPLPTVQEVMGVLDATQIAAGGDPYIGRKLVPLFESAGFSTVTAKSHELRGDHANPAFFRAFAEEFAEILESIDEATGPSMREKIARAVDELRALPDRPGTSLHYAPVIVRAVR